MYYLDDYAGADAIYRAMLKENEADQGAMVGLARNMIERKEYKDAVEILEKCRRYDADYAEVFRFLMQELQQLQ